MKNVIGKASCAFSRLSDGFRKTTIQKRLLITLILISIIPLIITALLSYNKSSSAIESKISTFSQQLLSQVSNDIEKSLEKVESYSAALAISDPVQNIMSNYDSLRGWDKYNTPYILKDFMVKDILLSMDYITDISIYTNRYELIQAYTNKKIELRMMDESRNRFLKRLEEKRNLPVWSWVDKSDEYSYDLSGTDMSNEEYHGNGIIIGRSFSSLKQGRQVGYLLIRLKETFLSGIYKNIDMGKGTRIFIIDTDGTVISSRNSDISIGKPYADGQLIRKISVAGERDSVLTLRSGREDYLVAFSSIGNTRWYLIATIPFSYLNEETRKTGEYIILLCVVCLIFAAGISFIIFRSISRPVRSIIKTMDEVKKGNLQVKIVDGSRDELSEMADNFNNMVGEIRNLLEKVRQNEKQKRIAELNALQAQINPHFLANSLNTVKWMAGLQKAENIESLAASLIELLNISMGRGSDLIALRQEIEYIKHYIHIQEYRFYNKFNVTFEIEDEILDDMIIKLTLQPVIENAIIHGIAPLKGQGTIAVKGYREEGCITINVIDNGVGMDEDRLQEVLSSSGDFKKDGFYSIGIKNVDERIKLYYGEEYGIKIKSVPALFTQVEFTFPSLKKEEASG